MGSSMSDWRESFEKFKSTPYGDRIKWESLFEFPDDPECVRLIAKLRSGHSLDYVAKQIAEHRNTLPYKIKGKGPAKIRKFSLTERIILHAKMRFYRLLRWLKLK
jgi:hypothetical protein